MSGSAEAVQELVSSSRTSRRGGDYALAQADIERALRIEPRNPYLWLELGEIHLDRDDLEQAAATARKAMSVAGSDRNAKSAADKLLKRASRY
jgi:Flp pilus assembly protein TadD